MALGALIAAYSEDDSGSLRALIPIAGRTLLEYQVRCAAAAGAAPIVIVVERIPIALNEVLQRLQQEDLPVVTVGDAAEASSRFEAGDLVLLIADGLAPSPELLSGVAEEHEPVVVTVPDDEAHERFERIDGASRWSGVALVDAQMIGATAAMLGAGTCSRRFSGGHCRRAPGRSRSRLAPASRCWRKIRRTWPIWNATSSSRREGRGEIGPAVMSCR